MSDSDTSSLQERHQKIGQLLALALDVNHPALLDWAAVGFALQGLSAAQARADELHANGQRLTEAADGWKAEAERLRGIERALEDAQAKLAAARPSELALTKAYLLADNPSYPVKGSIREMARELIRIAEATKP